MEGCPDLAHKEPPQSPVAPLAPAAAPTPVAPNPTRDL